MGSDLILRCGILVFAAKSVHYQDEESQLRNLGPNVGFTVGGDGRSCATDGKGVSTDLDPGGFGGTGG